MTRGFRYGQIVSGGLLALAHGTNDAQKTMGVITLALVANGTLGANADPPLWVIVSSATAIALGTYSGGWRIIRTTGTRIIKMDAAQGFSAQGAGAAVILASTHFGFPLSTTHVINGGVMGAGAGKRVSAVRWGVAGNIVTAWLLTLPAAAAIGALAYGLTAIFGSGALGPVLVTLMSLSLIFAVFARRSREGARCPRAERWRSWSRPSSCWRRWSRRWSPASASPSSSRSRSGALPASPTSAATSGPLAAGAAAALAGLAVLATLAAVAFGIVVMTSK